jgi:hypothetical protein
MQRRIFIAGLVITALALPAPSIGWELVPRDEEREEELITPPTIQVIRPDLAKPISGPVTIQIVFRTQPGASIVTSTFVATYGFLGLDITERLLQHANLTPQGITAEKFRFLGASTTSRCPLPIRWGASPSALSS